MPAKADAAIDFNDRHLATETLAQKLILVDIDQLRRKMMHGEQFVCLIAQVTSAPRVQHHA
jgi:hypothetical protein